ncbi:MAG TPA: FG-GAP-like repeat-containing protein, partial [Blastocatellia bacterium]|nr:FG-GAP-like repeat-containing protein [Blastocatellia bacterium]
MMGPSGRVKNPRGRSLLRASSKPSVVLLLVALVVAALQFLSFGSGVKASAGKASSKLREEISLHATGRGNPWINLSNGRDLLTDYSGAARMAEYLEAGQSVPLSLASGDFDEDGVPDLVTAYSTAGGGLLTIHRGNIDSIYPDTLEARARKASGAATDAPFLSPGLVFESGTVPDLLEAGDFNADGHVDIAVATRGGDMIHIMAGDGRGSLQHEVIIALPGSVTALASGDVNRADGLPDLVVAVDGAGGPKLLVFEGPESAIRSTPEIFDLPVRASAIATGYLDQDYAVDIAIGAGRDLLIVRGRDRKLSLDEAAQVQVSAPAISSLSFKSDLHSLAIGDFTGDARFEIAVATADGSVLLVEEESKIKTLSRSAGGELIAARLSSLSHENILMIDRAGRRLHVWMDEAERRARGDQTLAAVSQGHSAPATLEVVGEPVAVLPMRLNMDGLNDLVILRSGAAGPTVALTQPNLTLTVCNTGDCGSIGCGSLRAAILEANQSSGADMIAFSGSFSGVPTIQLSSSLPNITEALTISATAVGSCGAAASDVSTQAVQSIALDGGGSVSAAFPIRSSGTVVRNFVVNRFINGMQLSQARDSFIEGNIIGLASNGNTPVGNAVGVSLTSGGHTIGGPAAPARNVISGNQNGIIMEGATTTDINVQNNIIGANAAFTALRGNSQNAVLIRNGATRNTIGGSFVGTANAIFGSGIDGLQISSASGNNVRRNDIGQNLRNGISILSGSGNQVGGTNDIVRNNVFLSSSSGVEVSGANAISNVIQGNFIGVLFNPEGAPLDRGNNIHGIVFNNNATGNAVGGTPTGAGNIIAFNRGDGVSVITGIRNLIISNRIFSNQGLGIDLGNDGPTANDPLDADDGPNTLLNFPELTAASILSAASLDGLRPMATLATIRITGVMRGAPNTTYFLQFFFTNACTDSSAQNDQQFLNAVPRRVDTDGQGNGPFDFTLNDVTVEGGFVNALATDLQNNTSEFSLCIPVTSSDCSLACNATVPQAAVVGSAVSFAANATASGCSSAPTYDWDFGDNSAHS